MSGKELEKFAKWFHQDFGVIFENCEVGTKEYLSSLDENRKKTLSNDISRLLKEYPGKNNKGLKNAWLRLGAQWWSEKESPLMLKKLASRNPL